MTWFNFSCGFYLTSLSYVVNNRWKILEAGWKLATASAILESWVRKSYLFCCFLLSRTYTLKTSKLDQWSRFLKKQCRFCLILSASLLYHLWEWEREYVNGSFLSFFVSLLGVYANKNLCTIFIFFFKKATFI